MALSSASTTTNVDDQYKDNAGWAVNASISEAKLFAEACTHILARPIGIQSDGHYLQYNHQHVVAEMNAAKGFIAGSDRSSATSSAAGSVRAYSMRGIRG